ncbi:hypothetical protein SCLCIDRAFT_1209625 [Scleroderma citrinum Foug A]|uniref:Uncharacterized protein n=1 Tax=Scleroderma citrinum Foug A TaxID=1036808 RepID=A0A0C3A3I5_9AGAM|nr:hypothetical protein SCLCIDRAFT_1209625 [Scleroderma citrinum Foug A]
MSHTLLKWRWRFQGAVGRHTENFNPIPRTSCPGCLLRISPDTERWELDFVSDERTICDRRESIGATCRVTVPNRFESMKPVTG